MAKDTQTTNVAEILDNLRERLDKLETRVETNIPVNGMAEFLDRLSAVEKAKNPDAPDPKVLADLAARVDAIENRGPGATVQPADMQKLSERVAALETRAPAESGAAPEIDAAHVNYVLSKYFPHERPAVSGSFADNTTATPSEQPAAQPVTVAQPNPQ